MSRPFEDDSMIEMNRPLKSVERHDLRKKKSLIDSFLLLGEEEQFRNCFVGVSSYP